MSYPNIIQNHTNDINTIKSTYLPLSGGTVKSLHCNSPLVIKAANTEYEGGELVLVQIKLTTICLHISLCICGKEFLKYIRNGVLFYV
jgi:hypothetical protein